MLFLKAEMTSECWHSIGPYWAYSLWLRSFNVIIVHTGFLAKSDAGPISLKMPQIKVNKNKPLTLCQVGEKKMAVEHPLPSGKLT